MKKVILSIDGMTCSACSSGLEKYLNKQKGINLAQVNLVMATATVEYDEKILKLDNIEEFIKEAGFKSLGEFKEIKLEEKNKKEKIKFIIFTVLAIFLMYVSMGHMLRLPTIKILDPHQNSLNYIITLFVITVSFLIYGIDIIKNGYKNLIHFTPNMDTLVLIGVISSLFYSIYNSFMILKGNKDLVMNLYFESTSIVIYFVKLGRYIDNISKNKTKEAVSKLTMITPKSANIKVDDDIKEVTIDEIKKSDIVVARPGDKIAVDGKIVFGKTHIDESFITGESKPVEKTVSDNVIAGSVNYDGYIEYEAQKIGKDSTISEIVKLVVEASNTKAPISKVADKVSSVFVPIVILIAIITFIFYFIVTKSIETSLIRFVSTLVVACPCSLGLASPLAVVIAQGRCAQNKIVVKDSKILENVQKVNTVVFDKTGTLTYGKLKISKINNYSQIDDESLLQIVGSIESRSTHPIAKAFLDYIEQNKLSKVDIDDFENIPGLGIRAVVKDNEFLLGNSKILLKYNIKNDYSKDELMLSNASNTIVYVVKNKKVIALIGINDIVRDNVNQVIKTLNDRGIETIMLTGDNENTAKSIAKLIGISKVIANVLPTKKADVIKELKSENKFVMMCGDGINDSLALTLSDVGVSVGNATDIAMDSSDVILINDDLRNIITLMNISKKTITNIKQNLFWAFFYNCLMIPIAMGVLAPLNIVITPMFASLAMVLSSLAVVLNALRLRSIKI